MSKYFICTTHIKVNNQLCSRTCEAVDYCFERKDGLDHVKFHKPGHSRFTWIPIPNEYQMSEYFKSFKLHIYEGDILVEVIEKESN